MATVQSGPIPVARPASAAPAAAAQPRAVATWLLVCCALVYAMVVVGGVTRLTHSGLSITEWQPIVGTVPPLSASDWNEAFAKYQATPEFRLVNHAMSLDEFKGIFWWEYFHRLLGRLIGVAFLAPFLWFVARNRVPRGYAWPLAGIFLLGGLQGALGWYMVKSGLVDDPRVSQFRLTAHLGLAFLILGAMLWTALSLLRGPRVPHAAHGVPHVAHGVPHVPHVAHGARLAAAGFAVLVFVMACTGGLVAGLRAGFAYNTFPLMNGAVVPPEILMLEPWWRNFFWNMATVQFDHRALAWLIAFVTPLLWWRVRRAAPASRTARIAANALLAMVVVQIALGIATLVNVVPLPLAALHQAGAVALFALALNLAHALR